MTTVDSEAATVSRRSIEDLEEALKLHPADGSLKKDLANAIMDRCLNRADGDDNEDQDLERIRALVSEIPEPDVPALRACMSFLDDDEDEAVNWLAVHAASLVKNGEQLTFDRLNHDFVDPFTDASSTFWAKLSEIVERNFPGSAATFYLQAMSNEGDPDAEASCYKQALDKDASFWNAAWILGDIYAIEKDWQSASIFYEKAVHWEKAREYAGLHFDYACCLGKLKRYQEEEKQLRESLRLDPNFENARNNLGLSVMRQKRYEEALAIFDEAIAQGTDGPYPFRNRADVLKKLKRYDEAIDAWVNRANWRGNNPDGRMPASIQAEINRLQHLVKVQADAQQSQHPKTVEPVLTKISNEEEIADAVAENDDNDVDEIAPPQIIQPNKGKRAVKTAAPTEILLEESIEKLIKQGREVFGRRLKLYESPDGLSARQYAFPDGRIDLLAEDIDSGDLVVIELKKDESHELVVGQILLYMNWAKDNIAREGQNVRGVICVFTASSKLRLAASNNASLELFEYDFIFAKI
jgi:tetratricopeptide (TPR) repeat protein